MFSPGIEKLIVQASLVTQHTMHFRSAFVVIALIRKLFSLLVVRMYTSHSEGNEFVGLLFCSTQNRDRESNDFVLLLLSSSVCYRSYKESNVCVSLLFCSSFRCRSYSESTECGLLMLCSR